MQRGKKFLGGVRMKKDLLKMLTGEHGEGRSFRVSTKWVEENDWEVEEGKEEGKVVEEARVNVVTDKWVSMKCFTEVETNRGTFVLPEIVEDEDMKIKREVEYNVWEKHGKCRIYMNGEGLRGYIEVLKDGTINVVAKGQYMVERRIQEAIGMFAKNEKVEIVA